MHAVSTTLREGALVVVRRLREAGFAALWAGGCVRDMLMGRVPKDYDVATDATPDRVERLFSETIAVGKAFGVIRVRLHGFEYEVATFRKDQTYADGRHPEAVVFTDARADAQRRDFTVNALFFDPFQEQVIDYIDGQADIERRLIRAVGDPAQRFREDHLRLLRAVRFASVLGFTIEPATFAAVQANAGEITKVSAERIQQELTRILLESDRPGAGIELARQAGLLAAILPEVEAMRGQAQPPQFHPEGDVYTHTIMMLNALRRPSLRLAYAVLLHDVAKPETAKLVDGRVRFDNHAARGAEMTEAILRRLRLSADEIEDITFCIANHMRFMDVGNMRRATLRRLVGAPTFAIELELHRLDCAASHGDMQNVEFLLEFQRQCAAEPVLPEPWIKGADILALGVPEGPEVGNWKKAAYNAQLEGRFTGREATLAWMAMEIAARRGAPPPADKP